MNKKIGELYGELEKELNKEKHEVEITNGQYPKKLQALSWYTTALDWLGKSEQSHNKALSYLTKRKI